MFREYLLHAECSFKHCIVITTKEGKFLTLKDFIEGVTKEHV